VAALQSNKVVKRIILASRADVQWHNALTLPVYRTLVKRRKTH